MKLLRPMDGAEIPVGEASFPVPFAPGLEFNSPAHGTWNIVHTGMQLPESHQIYVCAANCMRGVVLTAAEMNAADRFSFVILEERDLLEGTVEDITIEGTADVLRKLPRLPRVVLLFTVCLHHFLGCDLDRIYGELEARFPEVTFVRCFMDPIMQKKGPTPDQKLRKAMVDILPAGKMRPHRAALLGGDFPLSAKSELGQLFGQNGWELREMVDCEGFSDYLSLGESEALLVMYPSGVMGVCQAAQRLGRSFLYLPQCFGYEEIRSHWETLASRLGFALPAMEAFEAKSEAALEKAHQTIGTAPIAIDGTFHPRPLGLARLLLEHGFRVERVYLDAVSKEEEGDFRWLQENHPQLLLRATVRPEMRVFPRSGGGEKLLALGQKAAWFEGTCYFVNLVQGGGLWGFGGIAELAERMEEAFLQPKDSADLIPRKGLGCESCL